MYELLLAVHILAAITWIGGGYALTVMATKISADQRQAVAPHFNWYAGKVIPAAAGVLILAGIGLVLELDYVGFGDLWIILALAGWLLSGIFGAGMVGPLGQKIEAATSIEEVDALYKRLLTISYIDTVVVTLVVVDMVVKPGA